ncbi:unnamed protein product [Owenia fusiformis]|uniref:Pseudouridylate synthase 1 homolog n=1 Tax=Owenia fusiformis TaxID=6347 RepID=A0A8S4NRV6_OWEFU|nr:unnamed protein product [Owenia fusiformis]
MIRRVLHHCRGVIHNPRLTERFGGIIFKMASTDATAIDSKMDTTDIIKEIKSEVKSENESTTTEKPIDVDCKTKEEIKSEVKLENESTSTKRPIEVDNEMKDELKKQKLESKTGGVANPPMQGNPFKRKKAALMLVYSGKGYYGMQRQSAPLKSIEEDLLKALLTVGCINQEHYEQPGKVQFQRCARTDKSVSAAGQVVSLKMVLNIENCIEKLNENLPDQIRVIGIIRATQGFNSKNNCDARTYSYMLPTFALSPIEENTDESYRVPLSRVDDFNELLKMYLGTKNFHNFTSGKKPDEASAKRFIMSMSCGQPFVRGGIEFVVIEVKGQSFMLHQIRKMIGMAIAIMRGLACKEAIEWAQAPFKYDVPKAPGLGLKLEQVHYDIYNKRYGNDGLHDAIDWTKYKDIIDKFKDDYIYTTVVETEKEEKSMFNWLSTLPYHHFGDRISEHIPASMETGTGRAAALIKRVRAKEEEEANEAELNQSTNTENPSAVENSVNETDKTNELDVTKILDDSSKQEPTEVTPIEGTPELGQSGLTNVDKTNDT